MYIFYTLVTILYSIGLYLFIQCASTITQSLKVSHWPTAVGTIIKVNLQEEITEDNNHLYEVKIEYRYTVNNTDYFSTRLAYGYEKSLPIIWINSLL
jgi:hypothetical protein